MTISDRNGGRIRPAGHAVPQGLTTNELLARLREDKPPCPVCKYPADPAKAHITILFVPLSQAAIDPELGMLTLHTETCLDEAERRLGTVAAKRRIDLGLDG